MTTIEKLQTRWHRKTGEHMPDAIARLPIDRVTVAVILTESGQTVFVPGVPVTTGRVSDSIREWDSGSHG